MGVRIHPDQQLVDVIEISFFQTGNSRAVIYRVVGLLLREARGGRKKKKTVEAPLVIIQLLKVRI